MLKLFCVLFIMHFKCSETVNRIQKLSEFQSLFPDDYDKRTAPPQINEGKMLLLHKQMVLYLKSLLFFYSLNPFPIEKSHVRGMEVVK